MKNTIHTVSEVLDLYDSIDKNMPVQEFKQIMPDFEKHTKDYSEKSATLVGDIKTDIMDAIDAYYHASRHISEWSSLMMPLLRTHLKLFSDYSAVKAKAQNRLLQKLLDDGVERTSVAQEELDKIYANLDAADRTLQKLSTQLEFEFDEGSELFQKRLARMNRKISDKIVNTFTRNKRGKAVLNGRLEIVHDLIRKLAELVGPPLENIKVYQNEMQKQIKHLKDASNALNNYESITDNPELLESTVKATENLISKCNEYVAKHKSKYV